MSRGLTFSHWTPQRRGVAPNSARGKGTEGWGGTQLSPLPGPLCVGSVPVSVCTLVHPNCGSANFQLCVLGQVTQPLWVSVSLKTCDNKTYTAVLSWGLNVTIFIKSLAQCQCLEHIKHINIRNNNNCYYLTNDRGFAYDSSSTKLPNTMNSIKSFLFWKKNKFSRGHYRRGPVWSLLVILPPKQ